MTWLNRLLGREKAVQQPEEVRNYTDDLTAIYEARIAGSEGTGDIAVTAALESACGLWARCLAAATVSPDNRGLTPDVLAQAGRSLIRTGNSVWRIMVTGGGVRLRPVCSWQVHGDSPDEARWMYEITEVAPDNSIVTTVRSAEVLHLRIGVSPEAPYRGRAPMSRASMTASLAAWLEARGRDEASAQTGRLIPVNSTQNTGGVETTLTTLGGRTVLVPTTTGQSWDGRGGSGFTGPQAEWQPRRVGNDIPPSVVQLRMDAIRSVWQACGIPAGLLEGTDGTGLREMTRQFIHAAVSPVLRTLEVEARNKLDEPDLTFSLESLGATDVASRSRAFGSLVGGGMAPEAAAAATGFSASPGDFRKPPSSPDSPQKP